MSLRKIKNKYQAIATFKYLKVQTDEVFNKL